MKQRIHPTAVIGKNVEVGNNVYIGPHCIIGYPAEHKDFWPAAGKVIIGDNVIITGLVTIDAGTEGITKIGNGVMLMKHSHVGHDAVIEDNVTISCGAKIGGHAIIKQGANIGLNACVHQRVTVEAGCMIGMQACVTKTTNTQPFFKYAGVPAKCIGENKKP